MNKPIEKQAFIGKEKSFTKRIQGVFAILLFLIIALSIRGCGNSIANTKWEYLGVTISFGSNSYTTSYGGVIYERGTYKVTGNKVDLFDEDGSYISCELKDNILMVSGYNPYRKTR